MRKACVAAARVGICGRLPYNRRMARDRQLILNRYRPIGEAKAGGFGTVRVAWDTRIQRKVAIKCIELDEVDAARAASTSSSSMHLMATLRWMRVSHATRTVPKPPAFASPMGRYRFNMSCRSRAMRLL